MSGSEEVNSVATEASAVDRQAADWASAKHSPKDWSVARQIELEAWIAQSLAHRVAFLRMDLAWQRAERIAALRAPMQPAPSASQSAPTVRRRIVIALGLVALLGAFAGKYLEPSHVQLIETPKGGQEKITLADGSQVELNTNTALKVNLSEHERSVELVRGEAYFEIKHDVARPFSVMAGNRRIVDLGTKFVVRLASDQLTVSLLEGKASLERIHSNAAQRSVVLSPGDVALATADATQVSKVTARDLSDSLAWRRGSVVFHYQRLDTAVAELNRYGGPQLVIADADSAKLLISGTFLTNKPEDFAGIAHEIFGLRVQHRNDSLILSR
jgi:transmembrane sensor